MLKPGGQAVTTEAFAASLRDKEDGEIRNEVFDDGHLYIHFDDYLIRVNGRELRLTLKEFSLLKFLIRNEGLTLSRDKLIDAVWKNHRASETRTIDVHICKLRRKLGPEIEGYIQTVVGVGYQFNPQTMGHLNRPTAKLD